MAENITKIDDNEFAVAKTEAEKASGVYVHKFAKPYDYEDRHYEELTFDFDALTGEDSLAIESELQALGKAVIVPEFSGDYLVRMAVRACTEDISVDALLAAPLSDFNAIKGKARSFLLHLAL